VRDDIDPPPPAVRRAVATALDEDLLPLGDVSAGLLPADLAGSAQLVARGHGVLAGCSCADEAFAQVDPDLKTAWALRDGADLAPGSLIGTVEGGYRSILTAERTALNFLCHLSGVATLTRKFVVAVGDRRCRIADTRKTTPGLRALEKAAVRAGGGVNHRGSLSEAVLVKDNHLAGTPIAGAVAAARKRWPGRMIEVECDLPGQVEEAVRAGAGVVMLDNMAPAQARKCVALVRRLPGGDRVLVEASGGINLDNAASYAAAGVDFISVGALTHSAPALDIGLDVTGRPG
jgi:nicotinate-nucleotide pyrophosphorylase (carboxylating)